MSKHFLLFILGIFSAVTLLADHKLAADLDHVQDSTSVDVIIQYRQAPTAANHRKLLARGAHHLLDLPSIKGGHYRVPAANLAQIAEDPEVEYVTPDRTVYASSSAIMPAPSIWPAIGYPASQLALSGTLTYKGNSYPVNYVMPYTSALPVESGKGVGIAVLDSGLIDDLIFRDSTCTKSRIVYSENFVPGQTGTTDLYGHGTYVAALIAGNGACTGGGVYLNGIASQAHLINMRVLDASGQGADSQIINAIDRVIALKSTYNIKVLNLSAGRVIRESFTKDPLTLAVQRAWQNGITVVVAAGNDGRDDSNKTKGYSTITSPANSPYVIAVGAARTDNTPTSLFSGKREDVSVATYSSKGPSSIDQVVKPDLMAPGNQLMQWLPSSMPLAIKYPDNVAAMNGLPIFRMSGTSVAAPIVSAAAALLLEKDSSITADQIKARLMKTAWKGLRSNVIVTAEDIGQTFTLQEDVFSVGAGLLDLNAALASTEKIGSTQSALSPRAIQQNGAVLMSNSYSGLSGSSVIWGTSVMWGTSVIWGTGSINSDGTVSGNSVIWGTGSAQGTSVIWGTGVVVWATSNPFAEMLSIAGDN